MLRQLRWFHIQIYSVTQAQHIRHYELVFPSVLQLQWRNSTRIGQRTQLSQLTSQGYGVVRSLPVCIAIDRHLNSDS